MAGLSFTIPGRPFTKNTKRWNPRAGKIYTTSEGKNYQRRVAMLALEAKNRFEKATLVAREARPVWSVLGTYYVSVVVHCLPRTRFDIDNVIKPILDAGTRILWRDDSQVHSLVYERLAVGRPEDELVEVFATWTAGKVAPEPAGVPRP